MKDLDLNIDKLLEEVKDIKKAVPGLPKGRSTAEALALFVISTKCKACGEIYKYPSSHLMVRYRKNYSAAKELTSVLLALPHETKEMEMESERCQKCW